MMQQDLYSVIQNKFNCDITVDNIIAVHKKTNKQYVIEDVAINATNKDDNTVMIIYRNNENMLFCREATEFFQKFEVPTCK